MSNVQLGFTQIIDPASFKSINLAKIYIGEYGTLPNPANTSTWKQAYFVNSDGTRTAASQPIRTNAAGYAVDGSGNIKTIQVDGGYSLLVQDQLSVTKFSQACSAANFGSVLEFDTIAGFTGALDGSVCYFKGRDTVGDGGGGYLRFLAGSTTTANGVTIYAVTGGRLVREGWSVFGISPAWAGAKCDGIADDTAAIQSALSSMPNGGTIRTAPGQTYLINAVSPNSNTTITGGGTFKFKNNTAAFALILADLKSNITLDGVVFDGNIANQTTWSEFRHCVQILGSAGVTVRNCTFQNIIGDGVYIGVSGATLPSDVKIHGNRFIGDNTNRNGVSVAAGSDINIYGNHFYKMARPDMPGAVDIEPNVSTSTIFNVNVNGNTFVGHATPVLQKAITVNNAQAAALYNINICNNSIKDGYQYAIAVFGDNATRANTKANIVGNTIYSAITLTNSCGIIVSQGCEVNVSDNTVDTTCDIGIKSLTSAFKFSGNKVKNAAKYGIEAIGGVTDGLISGNYIEDCGTNAFAAYGGVHLQSSYTSVIDNKIISSATTKTQAGIYIESGVKNFVDGNTIRGVGVRALNFAVAPQVLGQNIYSGGFNSVNGTYPPATETWVAGDRIYHANPTAGGFIGWVCTTAGTPGTWKTFGAISA